MLLLDMFTKFNELAKELPLIGSTISITLAAGVVGAFWKGPKYLQNRFEDMFVVRLSMDNSGEGNSDKNFKNFLEWFEKVECFKFTKSVGLVNSSWSAFGALGPGVGTHWMIYKKRLYRVVISRLESQASTKEKLKITISTVSLNKRIMVNFFNEFSEKRLPDEREIFTFAGKDVCWSLLGAAPKRKLSSVIINKTAKAEIIETIDKFLNNKQWYVDRGIPYKLTILLYGPPGTGKTSIIKAVAHEYDREIAMLNISTMTNLTFAAAFYSAPKNSIITLEDIESCKGAQTRAQKVEDEKPVDTDEVSIVTILNTLDGLKELSGEIIFITTNIADKLSKALTRPGRVDKKIFIPAFTDVEIKEYITMMYPDAQFELPAGVKITGGELQELVIANKWDFNQFNLALKEFIKND